VIQKDAHDGQIETNATTSFYQRLNDAAGIVIASATADPGEIGRVQHQIDELNQWRETLANRPESVALQSAISEATVGVFLLVSGLYRPAFVSLRLLLELSLATVHFATNRLELAEWVQGRRDVRWSILINQEQGVLSHRYSDAFFPALGESVKTYNAIGAKVYRELSEYVHGNHYTWGNTTDTIAFNAALQSRWVSQFEAAKTVVDYALTLRFLQEIGPAELGALSTIIDSSLGHIEPIRDFVRKERD